MSSTPMSPSDVTSVANLTAANLTMDLKTLLNTCKTTTPAYVRIADLREECGYLVTAMERVTTQYGEAVVVILEGQIGDDYFLRVYLPRRFNLVLSDIDIANYNNGIGDRIRLVKRRAQPGSSFTPLEFV